MIPKHIFQKYLELTKPRITSLVLVTVTLGYILGMGGIKQVVNWLWLLVGVYLVCSGSAALNHYLERDVDALMDRTKNRPIPAGNISPSNALNFGTILILGGVFLLWGQINLLTAFLSLLTAFLYVLVYTPLKRVTWLNTTIGAIPGAIPPMGGWAAARGELGLEAWILFAIMFCWQHPHFYAIAWMFKKDYAQAGFKMLPVVHPDGKMTFQHIIFFSSLLLGVSLLPAVINSSGMIYIGGVIFLGLWQLKSGLALAKSRTHGDARNLLRTTVIYLPLLLSLIILDQIILS